LTPSDCQGHGDHCAWNGDSCSTSCFVHTEDMCPSDGCKWWGESCVETCWEYPPQDACDKNHCVWDDHNHKCKADPCSTPGEDCRETKCCSSGRGGAGMTCFEKNGTWATCRESCSNSSSWTCQELGERAPAPESVAAFHAHALHWGKKDADAWQKGFGMTDSVWHRAMDGIVHWMT
jgi:hypothetical protein